MKKAIYFYQKANLSPATKNLCSIFCETCKYPNRNISLLEPLPQSSLIKFIVIREAWLPSCPSQSPCLKRKTVKLSMSRTTVVSMSKTICNILKVRITCTVTKQMEIKLYTRVTMTAGP